jgi:hypothetical protein
MQISAPFAYNDVVPVLKNHRILQAGDAVPPTLRRSHALPITFAEMPQVARDYPIVFIKPTDGGQLRMVALLGLKPGENLFVNANGQWRGDVYRPAYLRRYPFCMASVRRDGETSGERIICVESAAIDADRGQPVSNAEGEALPWWQQTTHFLTEFEADLLRSEKVCDVIEKNGLLEPFTAQAVSKSAEIMNLSGMYRVSEAQLGKLKADALRMLISKGIMGRIYAHLMSLDRFAQLLDLYAARPH